MFTRKSVLFIALFSITLSISIPNLVIPMVGEGDAYIRANTAYGIAQGKPVSNLFGGGIWLPGHFLLLAAMYAIYDHPISPRILTLLFSIISIIPLYLLTKKLFPFLAPTHTRAVASITSVLYVILPIRIVTSTLTLSEPVFVFFLLVALYLLISGRTAKLFLGLVMLNIAHSMRFESWFITPVLIFMFGFGPYSFSTKAYATLLSGFFPMVWLSINLLRGENTLHFVNQKIAYARQWGVLSESDSLSSILSLLYNRLYTSASVLILIFILSGIIYFSISVYRNSRRSPNIRVLFLSIIPIYLFYLLLAQIWFKTMEWLPHRYMYVPIVLSLPFAGYSITRLLYHAKLASFTIYVCLIFVLPLSFGLNVITETRSLDFSRNRTRDIRSDLIKSEIYPLTILPSVQSCATKNIRYVPSNTFRFYTEAVFQYLLPHCHIQVVADSQILPEDRSSIAPGTLIVLERSTESNLSTLQVDRYTSVYTSKHFTVLRTY